MLGGMETDGKSSEGKDRSPLKKSNGSLGSLNMLMGKNSNGLGKASGAPANGLSSYRYNRFIRKIICFTNLISLFLPFHTHFV